MALPFSHNYYMQISKFPHYHQQESADCGPAYLRMIAKYYGRQYSLEMLCEHSFISLLFI